MEPLTTASTIATLVSLLSIFKSERRTTSDDEYGEFLQWLEKKRYDSLVEEISSNHLLGLSIKNLLSQNHEQVMAALETLNESIAKLASRLSGFNEIVSAISPSIGLSEQAVSILNQLESSGGSTFIELRTFDGTGYMIMDGSGGNIDISEPRFADDDLSTLVSLGLLRPDIGSKGSRLWKITREAARLAETSRVKA